MPLRSARTVASAIAIIVAPTIIWLHAFATSPAPSGPRWRTVPQGASSVHARSTSADSPPAMIYSVPARAPASPPETGTSTRRTRPPVSPTSRSASSRTSRGELVEPIMSSSSVPAASRESGPSSIGASWGRSGSITRTASTCSASSRGVSAQIAPASSSDALRVRECTARVPCAASRWPAIGSPIEPRPITPRRAWAGQGVEEASSIRIATDYDSPLEWTLFTPPEQPAPADAARPRVVIGVDLPEELCARIAQAEPRVEVVRDHELYRPRRFPADWEGDPAHERTEEQQRRFEEMVDSADVLFSLPDVDPSQLARTASANPRLRWVMTMAAGGGSQLRAAGLAPEQLERIAVTTSAGTHGGPLAEFALLGVLAGAKTLPRLLAQQRDHDWSPRWEMRQLDTMRVLVVGLGGIGKACAALFHAVGATVLGTTRSGAPVEGVDELVPIEDLASAAADVDAIVVTLPGTDATVGLVGQEVLG